MSRTWKTDPFRVQAKRERKRDPYRVKGDRRIIENYRTVEKAYSFDFIFYPDELNLLEDFKNIVEEGITENSVSSNPNFGYEKRDTVTVDFKEREGSGFISFREEAREDFFRFSNPLRYKISKLEGIDERFDALFSRRDFTEDRVQQKGIFAPRVTLHRNLFKILTVTMTVKSRRDLIEGGSIELTSDKILKMFPSEYLDGYDLRFKSMMENQITREMMEEMEDFENFDEIDIDHEIVDEEPVLVYTTSS